MLTDTDVQEGQNLLNSLWWPQMTFGTYSVIPITQNHENMDGNACLHGLFYVSPIDLSAKCNLQVLVSWNSQLPVSLSGNLKFIITLEQKVLQL